MPNILQHPHGFRVAYPSDDDDYEYQSTESGDVQLNTLYQMFLTNSVDTDSWAYRKSVLDTAIRFFGDIQQWLTLQAQNPCLYGNNYDFLCETLSFVKTGRRRLSVLNWIELMYPLPGPIPQGVGTRTLTYEGSTEDFIAQWCSQPAGFEDMLCTLRVLFGDARSVPARTNTNCN